MTIVPHRGVRILLRALGAVALIAAPLAGCHHRGGASASTDVAGHRASWLEPSGAPLGGYRRALLAHLELVPLTQTRVPRGTTEWRIWLYGPFGGMELYRLRERRGRFHDEGLAFFDRDSSVDDRTAGQVAHSMERLHRCRMSRPAPGTIGVCRIPTSRQQWLTLRDSLAALPLDSISGVSDFGQDGGWLIVERRRGAQYAFHAQWAPFSTPGWVRAPARTLVPVLGWLRTGQPERAR
jgi:hypothetical protein